MKVYVVLKEIVNLDGWLIGKYNIEKAKEFVKSEKEKSAPYYHCRKTVYKISEHDVN